MKKIINFIKKHKSIPMCLIALVISVAAWAAEEFKMPDFNKIPPSKPQGGWVVYWNFDEGLKEADRFDLDTVVVFGAGFDEAGNVLIPEEIDFAKVLKLQAKHPMQKLYLSFVNDVRLNNGKLVAKDVKLLHKLLKNEATMALCADEIVATAKDYKMQGVELDFENIWKEEALLKKFATFSKMVYKRTQEEGLDLRIVLEPKSLPSAELFKLDAEYVVMFYNLYGTHSGSGPKANKRFINKTVGQMEALGGPNAVKTAAFAGGGFRWLRKARTKSLTQAEAEALAAKNKAFVDRDYTGAQYFYYDEKDNRACVYYGDKKTFDYWTSIAKAKGVERYDLWCLGGNNW